MKITKFPESISYDATMSEDKFWSLVDKANWPNIDVDKVKNMYLKTLAESEAEDMGNIVRALTIELDKLIGDRNPAGGGDDSYWDLIKHIVGLGRKQFYAHLNDYSLIAARGNAKYGTPKGYTECFTYCIPYHRDYEILAIEDSHYMKWADKAIKELENLLSKDKKGDLKPIESRINFVISILTHAKNGEFEEFMKLREHVESGVDRISGFIKNNRDDLPRKFTDNGFNGYNEWFVKNMIADLEIYLEYKSEKV